jgi:hypothetical protein
VLACYSYAHSNALVRMAETFLYMYSALLILFSPRSLSLSYLYSSDFPLLNCAIALILSHVLEESRRL